MRLLWVLGILVTATSASVVHSVYWNSSNPLFETFEGAIDSPGYLEISASVNDYIKFICPRKKPRFYHEFTIISKVNWDDFVHCHLSDSAEKVGSCEGSGSFTIPLRSGKNREDIYYLTTSTGEYSGIYNRRMGLCLEKNMRLGVNFGLSETRTLEQALHDWELETQGLHDSRLYLKEENGEVHWKKNVHPRISNDLDHKISLSVKYDKNKEMEPIPISNEYFIEKLEEMNQREESYIFSRKKDSMSDNVAGYSFWPLLLFIISCLVL